MVASALAGLPSPDPRGLDLVPANIMMTLLRGINSPDRLDTSRETPDARMGPDDAPRRLRRLLDRLAAEIGAAVTARPLRVAIDGPPAPADTLADKLAVVVPTLPRRPRPRRDVPGAARPAGSERRSKVPDSGLPPGNSHHAVPPDHHGPADAVLLFGGVFLLPQNCWTGGTWASSWPSPSIRR